MDGRELSAGRRTPWQAPPLAVAAAAAADDAAARALARRLALPLAGAPEDAVPDADLPATGADPHARAAARDVEPGAHARRERAGRRVGRTAASEAAPWRLLVDGDAFALVRPDGVRLVPDFSAGRVAARQREPGRAGQPLARALGIARLRRRLGRVPRIVDATAGLGRDGWFAAALGAEVTLVERSVVLHALLGNALARARADSATAETAARVTLLLGDARERLPELPRPDVVYLDPMYPPGRRRAAVKKEMQFLHALLGPEGDGTGLLDAALAAARHRVTVKRPSVAPPLAGGAAFAAQRATVRSAGTRYDIYTVAAPERSDTPVSP